VTAWPAAFARFLYEFVVGDDWTIAVAVAGALVAVWALDHTAAGYLLLPAVVVVVLAISLRRAVGHR
jgi:hypothetical protein